MFHIMNFLIKKRPITMKIFTRYFSKQARYNIKGKLIFLGKIR